MTTQSYPNVFSMSSLSSKAILLRRMSFFPPDAGLSQPNSQESVPQRFPSYVFPFHPVLFIKDQFLAGLSPSRFAYPLQKHPDKSFTLRVQATFGMKYPIGTIRTFLSGYLSGYFFIRIPIRIFFIRIAPGSTSDSHLLSVNARPIWIKNYPTLYLSDSHPPTVNLA